MPAPSSVAWPSTKAPSTIPWLSVATTEPPWNEADQNGRCASVLNRNSNATPRRISASSMMVIGR